MSLSYGESQNNVSARVVYFAKAKLLEGLFRDPAVHVALARRGVRLTGYKHTHTKVCKQLQTNELKFLSTHTLSDPPYHTQQATKHTNTRDTIFIYLD